MPERIVSTARGSALSLALLLIAASCSFVGRDTTRRPDVCVIVAPVGLRSNDVSDLLAAVLDDAAAQHATITVLIGDGRSAAAFERVAFTDHANGGVFASKAANQVARDEDARRWAKAAQGEIMSKLPQGALSSGLDLIGGLRQCAGLLRDHRRHPTVVVVSTGLHRTKDLDLADGQVGAPERATAAIVAAVPEPIALELYGLNRVDPAATKGSAWSAACDALQSRCTLNP
jgi:hypothetical protein